MVYDKEDFTKLTDKFDIIFDAVGKTNKNQGSNLLHGNGVYVKVCVQDILPEPYNNLSN